MFSSPLPSIFYSNLSNWFFVPHVMLKLSQRMSDCRLHSGDATLSNKFEMEFDRRRIPGKTTKKYTRNRTD